MGRIDGRLRRLEERAGVSPTERERAVERRVLARMTDEELNAYETALVREAGEDTGHEDRAIVARVEALYREVRYEFIA